MATRTPTVAPSSDNDNDGIPDTVDKCPNEARGSWTAIQDADGCPEPDNDNDSVLDVDDFCPNTPGQPGGARSRVARRLIVVTAKEIRITQQIHFEFNAKAKIRGGELPHPRRHRTTSSKSSPKITLEIQGHTDNVGASAMNLKLSQSRADSVKAYLVKKGLPENRLVAKGFGMTQPLVPNDTAANKALNRRVQFLRTEGSPGPAKP